MPKWIHKFAQIYLKKICWEIKFMKFLFNPSGLKISVLIEEKKQKNSNRIGIKLFHSIKKDRSTLLCFSLLIFFLIISLSAPLFLAHSPNQIYEEFLNLPPFWMEGGRLQFPLGTDDLGRDFLARLIYGGKISFMAGGVVMVFSFLFGVLFGALSGFFPKIDPWIMGAVDILMSFPGLLLAIVAVAVLGPGLFNACMAVSLMCLPVMIRLARSLVLREKNKSYVESSQSFGASPFRLIFRHILPNSAGEILVQSLLTFSEGILSVAALSFLGLGARPPLAEWGVMIADGRSYLESAWWLVSFPGLCILIMIFCINILGEKLRDVFDPTAFASHSGMRKSLI